MNYRLIWNFSKHGKFDILIFCWIAIVGDYGSQSSGHGISQLGQSSDGDRKPTIFDAFEELSQRLASAFLQLLVQNRPKVLDRVQIR